MAQQSEDLFSALLRDLDLCFVPGVSAATVGRRLARAVAWDELTSDERYALFQHAGRRMAEHEFDEYTVSEAWESVALSATLHADAARWLTDWAFSQLNVHTRPSEYGNMLMPLQVLRLLMVSKSDIPVDVVDRVARLAVRYSQVNNRQSTQRVVAMQRVAVSAVYRDTCPVDVLEAACWHPLDRVRMAAAQNPNTPAASAVAAALQTG